MHFNRGDIAVVSLSGAVEESDRIQVFTAEKYKSLFTYSIEQFTSFRVIALIFTVAIFGNFNEF